MHGQRIPYPQLHLNSNNDMNGPLMQHANSVMIPGATGISQTPRLKAKTITSPILGDIDIVQPKRATSVLDQDLELMGLSQNNAAAVDGSFLLDYGNGTSMA